MMTWHLPIHGVLCEFHCLQQCILFSLHRVFKEFLLTDYHEILYLLLCVHLLSALLEAIYCRNVLYTGYCNAAAGGQTDRQTGVRFPLKCQTENDREATVFFQDISQVEIVFELHFLGLLPSILTVSYQFGFNMKPNCLLISASSSSVALSEQITITLNN